MKTLAALLVSLTFASALAVPALAAPPVDRIDVEEHLGAKLPLDARFFDEDGRPVTLSGVLSAGVPVLLSIAYYKCPMLCGLVLNRVKSTVREMDLRPGTDYRLLTISFDPEDRAEDASRRKIGLGELPKAISPRDWPFWTGDAASTAALLEAAGVRVARDPETGQFGHPAVIFAITPDGRIARYLYGVEPTPFDTRLALVEAGRGKTGTTLDRVLLRCFAWDPAQRKYALFIASYMRVGGALLLGAVSLSLFALIRRDRAGEDLP